MLKLADVTPVFKKGDPQSVKNYRPVNVLPNVSKVFERIMLKKVLEQMNKFLSQNLCGYRKGFSTQMWKNGKRSWMIMGMLVLY